MKKDEKTCRNESELHPNHYSVYHTVKQLGCSSHGRGISFCEVYEIWMSGYNFRGVELSRKYLLLIYCITKSFRLVDVRSTKDHFNRFASVPPTRDFICVMAALLS